MIALLTAIIIFWFSVISYAGVFVPFPGPVAAVGGSGPSSCSTASYLPSADVDGPGTWTQSTGTTLYQCIDEYISSPNTSDYIYTYDNLSGTDIIRVSLPGDCNVSTVRVRLYAQDQSASVCAVSISISPDNSTWETSKTFSMPDNAAEVYQDWTVSWTTPQYVYIRLDPSSLTYDQIIIYSIEVRINP